MAEIGSQVRLGFRKAFRIALRGIRIRFGRSLVTVAGVGLGIAFLMSNVTSQLVQHSVSAEREVRQKVGLMWTLLHAEAGDLTTKRVAVAAFGALNAEEAAFLKKLAAAGPAELRVHGAESAGFAAAPLDGLATGADLCVALGAGPAPASALALTDGMPHRVLLDSLAERRYAGEPDRAVRRELFFGERLTEQTAARQEAARQGAFRLRWIVTVSLVVTVIGVSNALLMSVTERFREIGTMKCLGALSSFIRLLFLIESSLIGLAGSILGALAGTVMATAAYAFSYGFGPVLTSMAYGWLLLAVLGSIVVGTLLSIVAAIYPATIASRMVPAAALRSTV